MNKEGKQILDNFQKTMTTGVNDNAKAIIKKSDFDKTLIGFVSDQQTKNDGTVQWEIQTEGAAYMIDAKKSNITTVGQRVRLYLPNHDYRNKYAEVIDDIFSKENLIEIVKVSDNEVYGLYQDSGNKKIKYKQTITAEGSGNERHNFAEKIEIIQEG
jgi:hypothetical protein|nr:MAG TPA: hypothetical protein [Caudoviricetes sp.]